MPPASHIVLVGIGGALGAIARYSTGLAAARIEGLGAYPLGTTLVNLAGCFLIGILSGYGAQRGEIPLEWRLFLITGILGGFTTFSAFGYEVTTLLRSGDAVTALLAAAIQVVFGLAAVAAGLRLAAVFS